MRTIRPSIEGVQLFRGFGPSFHIPLGSRLVSAKIPRLFLERGGPVFFPATRSAPHVGAMFLGPQTAQSSSYLCTLGPKVGMQGLSGLLLEPTRATHASDGAPWRAPAASQDIYVQSKAKVQSGVMARALKRMNFMAACLQHT